MTVIVEKFLRGVKLGKRERAKLAKRLECSESELLAFLRRRRLYPIMPGEDPMEGIGRGVYIDSKLRPKTNETAQ